MNAYSISVYWDPFQFEHKFLALSYVSIFQDQIVCFTSRGPLLYEHFKHMLGSKILTTITVPFKLNNDVLYSIDYISAIKAKVVNITIVKKRIMFNIISDTFNVWVPQCDILSID